jgi:hypothetical protein
MSQNDCIIFDLPSDFAARSQRMNTRIEAGEAMTMQYIADQLGVPFEFFAAAQGIMLALKSGKRVIIDPAPSPPNN